MTSIPLPILPPSVATQDPPSPDQEERQPLVFDTDHHQDLHPSPTTDTPPVHQMAYKDAYDKPEGRYGDAPAHLAAVASVAVFLLTTWIIAIAKPSAYGLFTWHPLLQSLAIACFTYGIITLQPTSQPRTKAAGLTRHQLTMLALAVPIVFLGTSAVYVNKIRNDRAHFTTWHGTFGIITFSLTFLQIFLGAGSVWFDGRLFGGNPKAKLVWKYHRVSGYVLYPLYIFTAYLGGAWSHWTETNSVYIVRLFAYTIALAVLLFAVFSRVRLSKMKFF